jgi:hypothetical protein
MKIDWKEILSPIKIAELTYGKDASRFNGLDIIVKEVNDVSERWEKFVKENFIPKTKADKQRKEALEALLAVVEDIQMLRTGTWEPDDDSCDATVDNLKLVIKYIEKQKGV